MKLEELKEIIKGTIVVLAISLSFLVGSCGPGVIGIRPGAID